MQVAKTPAPDAPGPAASVPDSSGPSEMPVAQTLASEPVIPTPSPIVASPPETRYHQAGRATPENTLQTYAWVCDQADTAAMRELIYFEPAAETKLIAYYQSLPITNRAQWPDMPTMAASMLIAQGMQRPFPAADILAVATFTPVENEDYVRTNLPGTSRDGMLFKQAPDGWRYVITEAMVDEYLAYVTSEK